MKVNNLSSEQMSLLGKLVKRKTQGPEDFRVRDSVSLSSMRNDQEEKVFIRYEGKKLDFEQAGKSLQKLGVNIEGSLKSLGGFSATLDTETIAKLEKNGFTVFANPHVQVVPDTPPEAMEGNPYGPSFALSGNSGNVIKMDTAAPTTGASEANNMGYTGKGIGIAIIDTGVAPHPDLIGSGKLVAFKDFVNNKEGVSNAYDDNGHGTHVAGDAAGSGYVSNGLFKGTAPDANIDRKSVV